MLIADNCVAQNGLRKYYEKLELLKEFSKKHKVIVVLKGAYTVIAKDGQLFFNTTGNPALATAGSGDVLLGIITSLRAQGLSAIDAATAGVFIHGKAGDFAAGTKSMTSLLARDIIKRLGSVFLEFSR